MPDLIARDLASLIHPLHDPAAHRAGRVWVPGRGAMLGDAVVREGADTVAMFLAEPVIGVGGVIVPLDDYFSRSREICDRHDMLFARRRSDHRLRQEIAEILAGAATAVLGPETHGQVEQQERRASCRG